METDERFANDMEPLRRQVEEWRSTRQRRERMPQALWEAAAELARQHGVNPVARALHLDFYRLQGRVQPGSRKRATKATAPAFVQVQLPAPAHGLECTVELEDRRGAKMNLRLVGGGTAEVSALVQSFWRRQP